MQLLFKITTGVEEAKALIKDTTFKDHYPSVNRNMSWLSIKPYIKQATRDKIIPFIGEALYDDLVTKYQADQFISNEATEILDLLQDAIAYYTIEVALPTLNVVIADMGVQESIGKEGTSLPVSRWRYDRIIESVGTTANTNLDTILQKLEQFIAVPIAYFDLWKDDKAYTHGVSDLFRATADLNEFLNINNSRRTFLAILPHIERSEIAAVQETVCVEQYERIRDGILEGDLTAEEKKLVPLMQELAALDAASHASPDLALVIEGAKKRGSFVGSDAAGLAHLREQYRNDAYNAQGKLTDFLHKNADDYPLFKASDCWVDPWSEGFDELCPGDVTGGVAM